MKHMLCKISRGVTLVEVAVVLAIFMVLMGVTVNIFISIIGQQKRILQEQEMLNQTSYAVEYMSRMMRMAVKDASGSCTFDQLAYPGYVYLLTRYHAESGFYQGVKFLTGANVCQEFFLDTDETIKEIKNGGAAQRIISDTFQVPYARFIANGNKNLRGALGSGLAQPRLTVLLNIRGKGALDAQEKTIQTTISQRNINN